MKRLLFLLLLIPSIVSAGPLQQKHLAVIAAINGGGGESFTCPSWSGDSLFSWQASDGTSACNAAEEEVVADTDTGVTIDASGIKIADGDTGEYLEWETGYANPNAAQTMCVYAYIYGQTDGTGTLGAITGVSRIYSSVTNGDYINLVYIDDSRTAGGYYVTTGVDATAYGGPAQSAPGWYTIGYSWDGVTTDGNHSAHPGTGDWATGEDVEEIKAAMTNAPNRTVIGNIEATDPEGIAYIYIKQVAIVSGYKFDCSTLTGW